MASLEVEALFKSEVEISQLLLRFADSMALKCAIELGLADIINSHGRPISLSQIASGINSPRSDMSYLARIMRYLVRKEFFTAHPPSDGGETLFGLNQKSRLLMHDSERSLASLIIMQNHPWFLEPWHCLSQCVKEGGTAFSKVHGCEVWDLASRNPEVNRIFNEAMACTSKIVTTASLSQYKDGFNNIRSLVDVAGGIGGHVAEIVRAYPHIEGINLDLPHVVATAPKYDGVSHVAGNMFEAIPNADAIYMQRILHGFTDESGVEILRNCKKAIPEKTGKLIIVDIVLQTDDYRDQFDDIRMVMDLMMIAQTSGGKERTEQEWKKLLEEGGFPRYKIIKIPALQSIIEAYPE
ncbi:PREDICTED: (R,S)-reticuline 7-O-methyltransferase-like [Populus euphratica]|uniref:(R,S)-reticuline 7-O-methyltransferase-like n=1 Tax=Populus euphratica TaxID=75702 RepID=A0AAJ6VDE0_POPEU|nr:PREDICTED: (R,S)-reticuline 7-O-methyltransferase-like [Populus euphratica]